MGVLRAVQADYFTVCFDYVGRSRNMLHSHSHISCAHPYHMTSCKFRHKEARLRQNPLGAQSPTLLRRLNCPVQVLHQVPYLLRSDFNVSMDFLPSCRTGHNSLWLESADFRSCSTRTVVSPSSTAGSTVVGSAAGAADSASRTWCCCSCDW
jgi:hypothetical protein